MEDFEDEVANGGSIVFCVVMSWLLLMAGPW